jgi:hypothetical protein
MITALVALNAIVLGGLGFAVAQPSESTVQATAAAVPDPAPGSFQPVTTRRLFSTQTSKPKIAKGQTRTFTVTGVPADATAVQINVIAVQSTGTGYLTVFPGGDPKPVVASVNFAAGQVVGNLSTVKLGADRRLSVFNSAGATDVIIDLQGYYLPLAFTDLAFGRVDESGSLALHRKMGFDAVSVTRESKGTYLLTLTGATAPISSVQVTPTQSGDGLVAGSCRAKLASPTIVVVSCNALATGLTTDSSFFFNIMG